MNAHPCDGRADSEPAHRAIAVLATENLITVSRGRRATVIPTPAQASDQLSLA